MRSKLSSHHPPFFIFSSTQFLLLLLSFLILFSISYSAKCEAQLPVAKERKDSSSTSKETQDTVTPSTVSSDPSSDSQSSESTDTTTSTGGVVLDEAPDENTSDIPSQSRIISGILSPPVDADNIVIFEYSNIDGEEYYNCAGSLISPQWVLTAAHCEISDKSHRVRHGSLSSTGNTARYDIDQVIEHPLWKERDGKPRRGDLALVKLAEEIKQARKIAAASPIPTAQSDSNTSSINPLEGPENSAPINPITGPGNRPNQALTVSPTPSANEASLLPANTTDVTLRYNVMRLNSNKDFAVQGTQPRYLRMKGYGWVKPNSILYGESRSLRFADLRTTACADGSGSDQGHRICTEPDPDCGPCFGDTGNPLYEVDKSGKVGVLVAVATLGDDMISDTAFYCTTDSRKPVQYTAVAPYIDWINSTLGKDNIALQFLKPQGLANTDLSSEEDTLAVIARTSAIVVSSLALLGAIIALLVTCTLRCIRRRRKRYLEGLHAEDSFVRGKEKDAVIVDPFEGIVDDHRGHRISFSHFSRAAVRGATEFSSRSLGAVRALLTVQNEEHNEFEAREDIEDAPPWVPGAWERLFKQPSRRELSHIHTVPTQRVVDDVLEGADNSVEPSPDSIAFKNAREEANLEAAWKKLEIQASLRNLSEASSFENTPASPSPSRTPKRDGSSRALSASLGSARVFSPPPNKFQSHGSNPMYSPSGKGRAGPSHPADLMKADTLLAAFASIDAESEQVAEETVIDTSALRALAMAKRPALLSSLRRKFSSGGSSRNLQNSGSERETIDEEETNGYSSANSTNNSNHESVRSFGRRNRSRAVEEQPSFNGERGSPAPTSIPSRAQRQASDTARKLSAITSAKALLEETSKSGRHSSMMMNYFSEDYSISNDSSDEETHQTMELEENVISSGRRYTEDRRPDDYSDFSDRNTPRLTYREVSSYTKGPSEPLEVLDRKNSNNSNSSDEPSSPLVPIQSIYAAEVEPIERNPMADREENNHRATDKTFNQDDKQSTNNDLVSELRREIRWPHEEWQPEEVNEEIDLHRSYERLRPGSDSSESEDESHMTVLETNKDLWKSEHENDNLSDVLNSAAKLLATDQERQTQNSQSADKTGYTELNETSTTIILPRKQEVDEETSVSVSSLKAMWNELARRDS